MTTMRTEGVEGFESRTSGVLSELETGGQLKRLQMIEGPMGPSIQLRGRHGRLLLFVQLLGLANHPEVVEAVEGLRRYGAGTASVRSSAAHSIPTNCRESQTFGVEAAYTFVSCWTATEAIYPTLCEPGDIIISDELNHACIIDGIRLATGS